MLILTRKPNEAIEIGDNVKVVYLGQNGHGQARLGIKAPNDVPVHREEIAERIRAAKAKTRRPNHRPRNPAMANAMSLKFNSRYNRT